MRHAVGDNAVKKFERRAIGSPLELCTNGLFSIQLHVGMEEIASAELQAGSCCFRFCLTIHNPSPFVR